MKAVVVGAGAVGLFCARELKRRGADVVVFEADATRAHSASQGAAGMLGPLSETLMEGPDAHPRLLELGLESLALWAGVAAEMKLSTFPPCGAVLLNGDRARHQALAALKAKADAIGFAAQWSADEALLLPGEAAIEPAEVIARMDVEVRAARVVEVRADGVTLEGGAHVDADRVVLAPGAWASDALIEAAPVLAKLSPMKGMLLELESDAVAPGCAVRGREVYLVGRRDGRVVVGATMEPGKTDLELDEATLTALTQAAVRAAPALENAKRIGAWAGVRPMSPDWSPIIGQSNRAIVACGHSRNGWLLAPIAAKIVSAIVFDDPIPDRWAAFAPGRF